jgi:hypothetical protein
MPGPPCTYLFSYNLLKKALRPCYNQIHQNRSAYAGLSHFRRAKMPETITITADEFRKFNEQFKTLLTKIQHYDIYHEEANLDSYFEDETSFLALALSDWGTRFPPPDRE